MSEQEINLVQIPHPSNSTFKLPPPRVRCTVKSRVVTRYVGSGIKGMGSGIRRVGSGITAIGSGITDHGIGISSVLGIRGQAVPYLWDQGRKLVTLLESRIRNLHTKMGSAMKKTYLVTTLQMPGVCLGGGC